MAQYCDAMDIERSESRIPGGDCSGKTDKRAAALLMTVDPMSWKPLRTGAVEIIGRIQTLLTSSHRGFPVPVMLIRLESCIELHRKKKRVTCKGVAVDKDEGKEETTMGVRGRS